MQQINFNQHWTTLKHTQKAQWETNKQMESKWFAFFFFSTFVMVIDKNNNNNNWMMVSLIALRKNSVKLNKTIVLFQFFEMWNCFCSGGKNWCVFRWMNFRGVNQIKSKKKIKIKMRLIKSGRNTWTNGHLMRGQRWSFLSNLKQIAYLNRYYGPF